MLATYIWTILSCLKLSNAEYYEEVNNLLEIDKRYMILLLKGKNILDYCLWFKMFYTEEKPQRN